MLLRSDDTEKAINDYHGRNSMGAQALGNALTLERLFGFPRRPRTQAGKRGVEVSRNRVETIERGITDAERDPIA